MINHLNDNKMKIQRRIKVISIFQKGWNFAQDGPGNRLLYHLQGCNLRCPWCSNPEGISQKGTLMIYPNRLLDSICPHGAITNKFVDRTICDNCISMDCITKNRNEGIKLSSKKYTIEELFEEIIESKILFHSGGGVTFTGGEPTIQFSPLKDLITKLKSADINIAVETNGTNPRLPELFEYLDTLIIDLKHTNDKIHKKIIGFGNQVILANIKKASVSKTNVWIRIPLIPGFNDSQKDIDDFIRFIRNLKRENLWVELLCYHEYGKIKWEQSGLEYKMRNVETDCKKINEIEDMFKLNNIITIKTGGNII